MSADQLRRQIRAGALVRTGVRTYRGAFAPTGPLAELRALVLDVGEPCWISGTTAAALHGFDGFPLRSPYHLTVPRGRHIERTGVKVHTALELPKIDQATCQGLPVLAPARTVIDLARSVDGPALARAIDSGLRDGRFNEDLLHRRIVALRSRGRYGLPTLLDVLSGSEISRGGHSWLERRFLQLVADAGLPRPLTQQVLSRANDQLVRVDVRFPGTPVVVELLGYRFHRSAEHLARDAARLNALLHDGFRPFQFTYAQVVETPDQVISEVRRALDGPAPNAA